jgi:ABC-type nickel/cobalt efflux system permease component RcnA
VQCLLRSTTLADEYVSLFACCTIDLTCLQDQLGCVLPDALFIVCIAVGLSVRCATVARLFVKTESRQQATRTSWFNDLATSLLEFVDVIFMAIAVSFLLHYSYVVMPSLRLYGDPKVCFSGKFIDNHV